MWTAGSPAPYAYWIDVGSTPGGNNYYQSKSLSNSTTSVNVCGLPTNGSEIFVTLYTEVSNSPVTWQSNTYTFYAANLSTIASPANGDPDLSGTQATFSLDKRKPRPAATRTAVDISAIAPGGNDIRQSGNLGNVFSTTNPLTNPLPDTNPVPPFTSRSTRSMAALLSGQPRSLTPRVRNKEMEGRASPPGAAMPGVAGRGRPALHEWELF